MFNNNKIKLFNNNKNGYSLVGMIVATTISVFLLYIISYFTYILFDRIGEIENETNTFFSIQEIILKINDYKNIYNTGGILIDSTTKSDIFLMKNTNQTEGILFGPVNIIDHKLDIDNEINSLKTFGFRKVSFTEMQEIENDVNVVFNYIFFKDMLISKLKLQDLNIVEYNSGKLYDLNIVVDKKYNFSNTGKKRSEISKEYLYKYNINF